MEYGEDLSETKANDTSDSLSDYEDTYAHIKDEISLVGFYSYMDCE